MNDTIDLSHSDSVRQIQMELITSIIAELLSVPELVCAIVFNGTVNGRYGKEERREKKV